MATWWLTNSEAADTELNKTLRASIREYQKAGYMTATFRSGREDLEENTQKLMRHNFELQSKAILAPIDGGEVFFCKRWNYLLCIYVATFIHSLLHSC